MGLLLLLLETEPLGICFIDGRTYYPITIDASSTVPKLKFVPDGGYLGPTFSAYKGPLMPPQQNYPYITIHPYTQCKSLTDAVTNSPGKGCWDYNYYPAYRFTFLYLYIPRWRGKAIRFGGQGPPEFIYCATLSSLTFQQFMATVSVTENTILLITTNEGTILTSNQGKHC